MRHKNVSDLRRVLCETKFFGMRPQPLEQYLYRLRLSQSAERVFWLHWDTGYRQGDFTSEIPLSEVARRICCDVSSVTRAYQRLRELGLVRRQDPGRDPANPYRQATAVTEVLIPREVLGELLAAPNRRQGSEAQIAAPTADHAAENSAPITEGVAVATTDNRVEVKRVIEARYGRGAMPQLLKKMVSSEREGFFRAQRNPGIQFVKGEGSQLDDIELEWLLQVLEGFHAPRSVGGVSVPASKPTDRAGKAVKRPRTLNTFSLAHLRKQLSQTIATADLNERFREIVWAVEEGALSRFEVRLAINIALKKVREQQWSRPHRMPPNWRCAVA